MQYGKKKHGNHNRNAQATKRSAKQKPGKEDSILDISRKPVRFYISRKGKVFPVRVLFQGETKYGDRAKVCLMNEKNPNENAWWCDSENLYQSKREAMDALESREDVPEEEGEEGDQDEEEEEGEEREEEQEEVIPY
jgi:hypothetical protein